MSESAHLGDAIHDLIDGRLDADTRARAEAHVAECAPCRRELEMLSWAKGVARREAAGRDVPPGLAAAISTALDREERRETTGTAPPDAWRYLRPALAFGLLVAVGVALLPWRRPGSADLPTAVAQDYALYRGAALPLERRTANPRELEDFFHARGIAFETRVFDLGMMGYRVTGGRVHDLAGRPSALFVYGGDAGKLLLCQMFEGKLSELPSPVAVREHDGIRFHVHRDAGLTLVFWQEGDVVCVLASEIPTEEVVQLAFAKAVRLARARLAVPQG